MENAGGRLKILRILNGYTQEALAAMIGAKQASLTLWEKGAFNPTKKVLPVLAAVLRVEQPYILFGTPPVEAAVWIPVPAARAHYTKAMNRDIAELMPQFLKENGLVSVITCELTEGKRCYFLSRDGQYNCMLLVVKQLVEGFENAFLRAELEIVNVPVADKVTIKPFGEAGVRALVKILAGMKIDVKEEKLVSRFKAKMEESAPVAFATTTEISKSGLESVFRAFGVALTGRPENDTVIVTLSQFFAQKYKDIPLSELEVNIAALTNEAKESLRKHNLGLMERFPEWF